MFLVYFYLLQLKIKEKPLLIAMKSIFMGSFIRFNCGIYCVIIYFPDKCKVNRPKLFVPLCKQWFLLSVTQLFRLAESYIHILVDTRFYNKQKEILRSNEIKLKLSTLLFPIYFQARPLWTTTVGPVAISYTFITNIIT